MSIKDKLQKHFAQAEANRASREAEPQQRVERAKQFVHIFQKQKESTIKPVLDDAAKMLRSKHCEAVVEEGAEEFDESGRCVHPAFIRLTFTSETGCSNWVEFQPDYYWQKIVIKSSKSKIGQYRGKKLEERVDSIELTEELVDAFVMDAVEASIQ